MRPEPLELLDRAASEPAIVPTIGFDHVVSCAVDNRDGQFARRFTRDGNVEVLLWLSVRPRDGAGREGMRALAAGIAFPNYPRAELHGRLIADKLAELEELVREAQATNTAPIPLVDDGHRHQIRFERFTRSDPPCATCEVCMTVLVHDVHAWAEKRGLVVGDNGHEVTLRDAIEKAVNKDG